jgi:hypothetical protein
LGSRSEDGITTIPRARSKLREAGFWAEVYLAVGRYDRHHTPRRTIKGLQKNDRHHIPYVLGLTGDQYMPFVDTNLIVRVKTNV